MAAQAIRADVALRLRALPGSYAYDCHGKSFGEVDHGQMLAPAFTVLFLSQLWGVDVAAWRTLLARVRSDLAALAPSDRDEYLAARRPRLRTDDAAEIAFLAFPSADRFLRRASGADAPFMLRDEYLFPGNVPLGSLELRRGRDRSWVRILGGGGSQHVLPDDERFALRRVLAALAESRSAAEPWPADSIESRLVDAFVGADALQTVSHARRVPAPGVYLVGHSGVLVRGQRTGVLVDPFMNNISSGVASTSFTPAELRPWVDAVALTHGHFDHYHLPTLLAFAGVPFILPAVPRGSVVCEDLRERLQSFGVGDVRCPRWGARVEVGDLRMHVLPFVGEQFLISECHPQARNWGNCYVMEQDAGRVLLMADSGFEKGRSALEIVADWTAQHGPVDVVLSQAIGLNATFGAGDPDLQLTAVTCASRAGEALALLRPEARVTFAPEDLPALCAAAGARAFVPYSQFRFGRGEPGARGPLLERAAAALASTDAELSCVAIGDGLPLPFTPGARTRLEG